MDDTIYVVPLAGRKIRDPQTQREVPEDGMIVTDTNFWRRRQRDGDIVISDPPLVRNPPVTTAAPAVEETEQ